MPVADMLLFSRLTLSFVSASDFISLSAKLTAAGVFISDYSWIRVSVVVSDFWFWISARSGAAPDISWQIQTRTDGFGFQRKKC